jgi:hypothetical protein
MERKAKRRTGGRVGGETGDIISKLTEAQEEELFWD